MVRARSLSTSSFSMTPWPHTCSFHWLTAPIFCQPRQQSNDFLLRNQYTRWGYQVVEMEIISDQICQGEKRVLTREEKFQHLFHVFLYVCAFPGRRQWLFTWFQMEFSFKLPVATVSHKNLTVLKCYRLLKCSVCNA